MKIRISFAGFRHGHILGLYKAAQGMPERVEIVAAGEDHEETRTRVEAGGVRITHHSVESMLEKADCDVVAIGDYYGRRGSLALQALERGKHVISDKPICTRVEELDAIEQICREKSLAFGCMLSMRDSGAARKVREWLLGGELGTVHAVTFGGQHPLQWGTRPGWYFEEGKHGGTINDIAVHALDLIPWVTGLRFAAVVAARCWNLDPARHPHFEGGAQFMLRMDNGCGVMGDVSYLAPSALGYKLPQYWRTTYFGSEGLLETERGRITLVRHGDREPRVIEELETRTSGYFLDFLDEIAGMDLGPDRLSTGQVLQSARVSLLTQQAADQHRFNISLA